MLKRACAECGLLVDEAGRAFPSATPGDRPCGFGRAVKVLVVDPANQGRDDEVDEEMPK